MLSIFLQVSLLKLYNTMRRNYLAPGGEGVVLPEMGSFFRPHVYDIVSPHVKESRAVLDSGFQSLVGFPEKNFPRFWNPNSLKWGEMVRFLPAKVYKRVGKSVLFTL